MILARVIGRSWSTIHHPAYDGRTVYEVAPVDDSPPFLAIDTVGANQGDTVVVLRDGGGARMVVGDSTAPVHSVVVGIVDHPEAV